MSSITIWTPKNITLFVLSCIILVFLIVFCICRLVESRRRKKHLKTVSNNNAAVIQEHLKKIQISKPIEKTWIELSNKCFALLDEYCKDEKEVTWIMNMKVWPIIDDMAYQNQKRAITELEVFGDSAESIVLPFNKDEWHKEYIKAKNMM